MSFFCDRNPPVTAKAGKAAKISSSCCYILLREETTINVRMLHYILRVINTTRTLLCLLWFGYSRFYIWFRSRNYDCLVTWFCYQLTAKPGNKTATVSWPDPYIITDARSSWLANIGFNSHASTTNQIGKVYIALLFHSRDLRIAPKICLNIQPSPIIFTIHKRYCLGAPGSFLTEKISK